MPLGDRLGLAGLIVGFFGIAAFYLWPTKKWIGWTSLVGAVALVLLWGFLELKSTPSTGNDTPKGEAAKVTSQASPPPTVAPVSTPPRIEIGLILGADKGIGTDSVVDCMKPIYTCLSQDEWRKMPLIFDAGQKGWARLIFRLKNVGQSKLLNAHTNIQSPNPISIDFAPRPDPSRLPRNVLDILDDHGILPFSISQSETALPIDIIVPANIKSFDLYLNIFGDNMKAHKEQIHFDVKH